MKKIFAFVLALSVMSLSYAQQKMTKEVLDGMKIAPRAHKMEVKKFDNTRTFKGNVFNNGEIAVRSFEQAKKALTSAADTAMYLELYGAMRFGYYPNGMEPSPALVQPWDGDVRFANISVMTGDQFGWFIGGEQLSSDTIFTINGAELGFDDNDEYITGADIMPTLMFADGASYQYGTAYYDYMSQQLPQYAEYFEAAWMSLPVTYKYPLTYCDFFNCPEMNYDHPAGWNLDNWAWDWDAKSYMFGSNFNPSADIPNYTQYGFTKRVDTIATEFGLEGVTMDIDTITLSFYSLGTFLPQGSQVKIDLIPLVYNPLTKKYSFGSIVASGTATIKDTCATYVYTPAQTGLTEELTEGVLACPIKAQITGPFVTMISGFNDNNANIGFHADNVSLGTTYHIVNGNFIDMWYTNLAISYNANCISGTGFDAIKAEKVAATKGMKNGRLFIEKNGRRFNALGAEVR